MVLNSQLVKIYDPVMSYDEMKLEPFDRGIQLQLFFVLTFNKRKKYYLLILMVRFLTSERWRIPTHEPLRHDDLHHAGECGPASGPYAGQVSFYFVCMCGYVLCIYVNVEGPYKRDGHVKCKPNQENLCTCSKFITDKVHDPLIHEYCCCLLLLFRKPAG